MRCRRCEPLPEEVRRAADLLGRRYALAIVYASRSGATRFNEFRQVLGPVPPTTLSARLDELAEPQASSSAASSTRARRAPSTR